FIPTNKSSIMKKLNIIALTLFFAITTSLSAQKIKVENESFKFNDGKKHALKVNVFTDKHKDIIKTFLAEATTEGGTVEEKRKEAVLKNVLIKSVSENPLTVYIAVDNDNNEEADFYASFEQNGEILVPKTAEYEKAEALMIKVAKNVSLPVVTKALDKAEKELHKLEDKQKKLEDDNKKLEQDTRKLEGNIKKNEKALEKTNKDLKKILTEMNSGKGNMDKLSKKKEKKDKITKKKEKLDKAHDKNAEKVKKDKKSIDDNKDKIKSNDNDIDSLKSDIKKQAEIVDELKKKYNAVK